VKRGIEYHLEIRKFKINTTFTKGLVKEKNQEVDLAKDMFWESENHCLIVVKIFKCTQSSVN
jgi:hypothetical protein